MQKQLFNMDSHWATSKQWPLAPNSPEWRITRANVSRRVTFFSKSPLANVGESGESGQSRLANVDECIESGQSRLANVDECIESDQNRLANVGESGEYLPSLGKCWPR